MRLFLPAISSSGWNLERRKLTKDFVPFKHFSVAARMRAGTELKGKMKRKGKIGIEKKRKNKNKNNIKQKQYKAKFNRDIFPFPFLQSIYLS